MNGTSRKMSNGEQREVVPDTYHYHGKNNNSNSHINLADEDILAELFQPGMHSLKNYNLRLAHQRLNTTFDKYLGENNVQAGIDHFSKVRDDGPMESLALAVCFVIRASLTLEQADIDVARECVTHCFKMCKKLMKNSFYTNLSKLVITPNYDNYTDLEIYAQLVYSQNYTLSTVLHALETNSVFTLIKLCYHLRGLVRTYSECYEIMKKRTTWKDKEAKLYFDAHVRYGSALTNVVISHTPPKFLRIMNFLGYKGLESYGLNMMNRVAFEMNAGFTSKQAQLTLIYYWVYAKPHAENIPEDLSVCKQLVDAELTMFPNSMLYGLARAKIEQIDGNFDTAIQTLRHLIEAPNLDIAYKAFYLELIWCYAIKCDWDKCIEYADSVKDSKHSPVCTAYLRAVFRYVKGYDTNNQTLLDQATAIFEMMPSLRIRHFGKTMTTEKAALAQAQLYFKKDKRLVLPVIAMLYPGNYLMFIRKDSELDKLMERVERELQRYQQDYETGKFYDDYLTALFYKAVLLRLKKKRREASKCFKMILQMKSCIESETSIVPMSTLEMGLVEMEEGRYDQAKEWLDHAEKDFSGYTAENYVHIKAYAAIRRMGHKTDKLEEDKEKLNRHIRHWLKYHEIDMNVYQQIITSDSPKNKNRKKSKENQQSNKL